MPISFNLQQHLRQAATAVFDRLIFPLVAAGLVAASGGGPAWLIKNAPGVTAPTGVFGEVMKFITDAYGNVLGVILFVLVLAGVFAAMKVRAGRHEGREGVGSVAIGVVLAIFAIPLAS